LCLISFTAWAVSSGFAEEIISRFDNRKRKGLGAKIRGAKGVGVNGDDVVFLDVGRGEKWLRAVEGVGGRASRGKSVVSDQMFTVNSEIWFREEGIWREPSSIRPSLLLAITDGRRADPEILWETYQRSDLLDDAAKEMFNIEKRLKPHLPPIWGGLGKVRRFDLVGVMAGVLKEEQRRATKIVHVRPKSVWGETEYVVEKSVRIQVPNSARKILRQKIDEPYRGLVSWTEPESTRLKNFRRRLYRAVKFVTDDEVALLKKRYHYEMDKVSAGRRDVICPVRLLSVAQALGAVSTREFPFKGAARRDGGQEVRTPLSSQEDVEYWLKKAGKKGLEVKARTSDKVTEVKEDLSVDWCGALSRGEKTDAVLREERGGLQRNVAYLRRCDEERDQWGKPRSKRPLPRIFNGVKL